MGIACVGRAQGGDVDKNVLRLSSKFRDSPLVLTSALAECFLQKLQQQVRPSQALQQLHGSRCPVQQLQQQHQHPAKEQRQQHACSSPEMANGIQCFSVWLQALRFCF